MNNNMKDNFSARIDFAKNLLKNTKCEPFVNLESTQTEDYVGISNKSNKSNKSNDSNEYYGSKDDDDANNENDVRSFVNRDQYNLKYVLYDLGTTVTYINAGTTGHTLKGTKIDENGNIIHEYAIKVVAYPKAEITKHIYGDINDARRPENAELLILKALSYFVVKKITPHLVLPLCTFTTSTSSFIDLMNKSIMKNVTDKKLMAKYKEFYDNYKSGTYYPTLSILVSEWANRGDFLDYVRKYYKSFSLMKWKVFLFQIISVLAVIQSKYKNFKHNDLKANNILIHKTENKQTRTIYTVNRQKYVVPNIGYMLKMWDYDFSCIPGVINNQKVSSNWAKRHGILESQNRYYDVHYFLHSIICKGNWNGSFIDDKNIPDEVKSFITRIVPEKYQEDKSFPKRQNPNLTESGRLIPDVEYTTPAEILSNDEFFAQFRNDAIQLQQEKAIEKEKSKKIINMINVTASSIQKEQPKINIKNTAININRKIM